MSGRALYGQQAVYSGWAEGSAVPVVALAPWCPCVVPSLDIWVTPS